MCLQGPVSHAPRAHNLPVTRLNVHWVFYSVNHNKHVSHYSSVLNLTGSLPLQGPLVVNFFIFSKRTDLSLFILLKCLFSRNWPSCMIVTSWVLILMNADRMECPHSGLACVSGVSLVCWLACQWCVSVVCWLACVSGVCWLACVSGVCQWCVCWLVSCMLDGLCQWCTGWLVSGVCQWCVGWLVSEVCWQLTVSLLELLGRQK